MDLAELAEALRSGQITIDEWESSMRDYLRAEYRVAMELVKGGADNVTPSDWGYEGSSLKKQYQYLNGFAQDMQNNPEAWMNGRLDARMNMYKESAYSALADFEHREKIDEGYTEERRILLAGDNCQDCIDAADLGWQPIDTLPSIGDSQCLTNCRCEFEYR